MAEAVDAAAFVKEGKILLRSCPDSEKIPHRKWKAWFGASPAVCADLWRLMSIGNVLYSLSSPVHLLWALMLMKIYATENVLASIARTSEKTFRRWAWRTIEGISSISYDVIDLSHRFIGCIGNIIKLTIDGTDCPIPEQSPFSTKWWTKKFNGPGLRYEIGLNILTGDICWVHGPFPCGAWPDIKVFRHALKNLLEPWEMVHADKGYRGDEKCSTPWNQTHEERRVSRLLRGRHETVNKRIKDFKILKTAFRQKLVRHGDAFRACATVTQLSISNGEPLFPVEYKENTSLEVRLFSKNLNIIYCALLSTPTLCNRDEENDDENED